MYEVVDSKLVLVAAFDANDAYWRGEYMDGILSHFGIDREKLPEQYNAEAERLYCENCECFTCGDSIPDLSRSLGEHLDVPGRAPHTHGQAGENPCFCDSPPRN